MSDIEQRLRHIEEQLDSVRVHTWLTKEFGALAYEDELLAQQIARFGPAFVAKHNAHLFSQTYEDAAISEIFARIGTTSKTFVEIGVEDGSENTTRLLLMLGWRGLWIEADPRHAEAVRRNFAREIAEGQLQFVAEIAAPDNVQSLIDRAGFGDMVDFMSIDVDLHTSHLLRAMRTRSRAACVEYNAHFPPAVDYETPYVAGAFWDGSNLFGASLKALERIAAEKGMALVGCDLLGVNAYFVASELTGELFPRPFTAEHHYQPARYQLVRGQRGHRRKQPGA